MARVAGCDLSGDLHNKYCVLAWVLIVLMGESAASVPDLQQNLIRAKVTE